jgi:7-carboxy-7-deazaguanine synthase
MSSRNPRGNRLFPVIEIFGPVIQGEGAMIGRVTHFIRFGLCDYKCSWCDTMYAVDPEQVRKNATQMTADNIVVKVRALPKAPYVTLSGGNPAIHDLIDLVPALHRAGYLTTVETQGTVFRDWLNTATRLTISPKAPSSHMRTDFDMLDAFIRKARAFHTPDHMDLKIVVFDGADFDFAMKVHGRYPDIPCSLQVGNPVNGAGAYDVAVLLNRLKWLMETVAHDPRSQDCRALPQMHTLVYGARRGV